MASGCAVPPPQPQLWQVCEISDSRVWLSVTDSEWDVVALITCRSPHVSYYYCRSHWSVMQRHCSDCTTGSGYRVLNLIAFSACIRRSLTLPFAHSANHCDNALIAYTDHTQTHYGLAPHDCRSRLQSAPVGSSRSLIAVIALLLRSYRLPSNVSNVFIDYLCHK